MLLSFDQVRVRRWAVLGALIFGIWTLLGLLAGLQFIVNTRFAGRHIAPGTALRLGVTVYWIWAFLTPFAVLWSRMFFFTPKKWIFPLLGHLSGVVLFGVVYS